MINKKTILVTGATGSIGGAAKVVLLGRKLDKLKARTHRIHTELRAPLIINLQQD